MGGDGGCGGRCEVVIVAVVVVLMWVVMVGVKEVATVVLVRVHTVQFTKQISNRGL